MIVYSERKMKHKKNKNPKPASEAKIQRLRDGVRERASTWSRFKKESRQNLKEQMRKDYLE